MSTGAPATRPRACLIYAVERLEYPLQILFWHAGSRVGDAYLVAIPCRIEPGYEMPQIIGSPAQGTHIQIAKRRFWIECQRGHHVTDGVQPAPHGERIVTRVVDFR